MTERLNIPAEAVREHIVVFLAFFTSEACRQAVPERWAPEQLAYELCRLWVEDLYLPGLLGMDGLKGQPDAEAVRRFEAAFTAPERAALERFHHFLLLRLDMLPASARQRCCFPQHDGWRNLVRDATYLLETLATDPEEIRSGLAWLVEAMRRDPHAALTSTGYLHTVMARHDPTSPLTTDH